MCGLLTLPYARFQLLHCFLQLLFLFQQTLVHFFLFLELGALQQHSVVTLRQC